LCAHRLTVQGFNLLHRLGVGDLSEVALALVLPDRKMISSTASFSMMFQLVLIFGRNSFSASVNYRVLEILVQVVVNEIEKR